MYHTRFFLNIRYIKFIQATICKKHVINAINIGTKKNLVTSSKRSINSLCKIPQVSTVTAIFEFDILEICLKTLINN